MLNTSLSSFVPTYRPHIMTDEIVQSRSQYTDEGSIDRFRRASRAARGFDPDKSIDRVRVPNADAVSDRIELESLKMAHIAAEHSNLGPDHQAL